MFAAKLVAAFATASEHAIEGSSVCAAVLKLQGALDVELE